MQIVLGLITGLGLFLYGMEMMSAGLQKAAGAKMRTILETLTKNKYVGILIGFLFTAVIQSSSATTVLVVSFVNASLMNLYQAAGIIMGANVGTTVTGLLMTLNLEDIAPVILLIGVVMAMFIKNPMARKIGEVFLGFGMLFIGLATMSDAMSGLRESPKIVELLSSIQNPFLAILIGFIITAILQSSSATVGIVMALASQGLIPSLEICFFLALGCNVGSCVSALLASLNGTKMAKRAALIHFIFNIIGTSLVVVILLLFSDYLISFVQLFSRGVQDEHRRMAKDIADMNTIFKLSQVIMLAPFSNLLVKLTYLFVPGDDEKVEETKLQFIGNHTVYAPSAAVPQVILEIEHMGRVAMGNLTHAMDAFLNADVSALDQIYKTEKSIDDMNTEITNYLIKANQMRLPVGDRKILGSLFHVVNDIERIGDHAENIADFTKTMLEDEVSISGEAQEEIREMYRLTSRLLDFSLTMFKDKTTEHLQEIMMLENEIDNMEKELQHNHVVRLTENKCDAEAGMIFSDLASNLERVADHGTNIAFSFLEGHSAKESYQESKAL